MKFRLLLLLWLVASLTQISHATDAKLLVHTAVSENAAEAAAAISELRAMGPAGLTALLTANAAEIDRHIQNPLTPDTPEWLRLTAALDAISQQKDSYVSGLYWYTDLNEAEKAARAADKPILSLRLLGNLNEEFSCANSRFFRTVLYANTAVSQALRERFVLHWQSVRPAPRVTIDFGDGRRIERTLTGNSIHYILDSSGRPLDALPGLYGPQAFLRALNDAEQVFQETTRADEAQRLLLLAAFHNQRIKAITAAWQRDTTQIGGELPSRSAVRPNASKSPRALEAAPIAVTKMVTEVNVIKAITNEVTALRQITDEAAWTKIAALHVADAQLDSRSLSLMRRQWRGVAAGEGAESFARLAETFSRYVALDTVRNEFALHTTLHAWLIADPSRNSLGALNDKVYAQLFLTPKSDPWLGLFSPETYTALENGGVVSR
jgi:hypothetical protein